MSSDWNHWHLAQNAAPLALLIPTKSETLGVGPSNLCFLKHFRWFWYTPKFRTVALVGHNRVIFSKGVMIKADEWNTVVPGDWQIQQRLLAISQRYWGRGLIFQERRLGQKIGSMAGLALSFLSLSHPYQLTLETGFLPFEGMGMLIIPESHHKLGQSKKRVRETCNFVDL